MKIQEIFDIIHTVHSFNFTQPEYSLSKLFFMRTGINLPHDKIIEMYEEIKRVVNSIGYSEPLDFIQDFFPNEDFRRIRIFRKNLELKIKVETQEEKTTTTIEEPKKNNKIQSPVIEKEIVLKPIKIKKEIFQPVEYGEIPPKDRSKILKYKKMSRRFKEMELKEKEIDNKYDYFMYKTGIEDGDSNKEDNRSILNENPFIGQFYNDVDLKFREVMYKIYKHNRSQMKDKTKMTEELEFLEEYFVNKLEMKKGDVETNKKLANAIAYLMKKLQNKIFESEEVEIVEAMMYFKTKLCLFYNYYRK